MNLVRGAIDCKKPYLRPQLRIRTVAGSVAVAERARVAREAVVRTGQPRRNRGDSAKGLVHPDSSRNRGRSNSRHGLRCLSCQMASNDNPIRGSKAVLSNCTPTLQSLRTQLVQPLKGALPAMRYCLRLPVEVCLSVVGFGDWRYQSPCDTEVEGEVAGDAPVVLNKRPEHLPTPPSHGAIKRLIVNRAERLTDKRSAALSPVAGPVIRKYPS